MKYYVGNKYGVGIEKSKGKVFFGIFWGRFFEGVIIKSRGGESVSFFRSCGMRILDESFKIVVKG